MALSSATPVPGALASATCPLRYAAKSPGQPEDRVRTEHDGIEEIVVDAAIDDVDALKAVGRAHAHRRRP